MLGSDAGLPVQRIARMPYRLWFGRKVRNAGSMQFRHHADLNTGMQHMSFRIQGLDPSQFRHLAGLSDSALERLGAKRQVVDAKPGFPDRIEVRDLEIGETAILLNFEHQPAYTAYRSRHAIFVLEGAEQALDMIDVVPEVLRIRTISLRAFDAAGAMIDADLVDGNDIAPLIARFFENPLTAYLHAHYAKPGCYAACIVRA